MLRGTQFAVSLVSGHNTAQDIVYTYWRQVRLQAGSTKSCIVILFNYQARYGKLQQKPWCFTSTMCVFAIGQTLTCSLHVRGLVYSSSFHKPWRKEVYLSQNLLLSLLSIFKSSAFSNHYLEPVGFSKLLLCFNSRLLQLPLFPNSSFFQPVTPHTTQANSTFVSRTAWRIYGNLLL